MSGDLESADTVTTASAGGSETPSDARTLSSGAFLPIVGGVMAALGSCLAWAKVSADYAAFGVPGLSVTTKGTSLLGGRSALVCALLGIACGIMLVLMPRKAFQQLWSSLALVSGLAVGSLGAFEFAKMKTSSLDRFLSSDGSGGAVNQAVRDIMQRAGIHVSLQFGLYLVLAGGIITVVGGIAALVPALRGSARPWIDEGGGEGHPETGSEVP